MKRFLTKKVGILCLCFMSVLAGLLIGRNIYQDTPTFQNHLSTVARVEDDANDVQDVGGGTGRRIQNEPEQFKLNIRNGGVIGDDVEDMLGGKEELPWEVDDDMEEEEDEYQSIADPMEPHNQAIVQTRLGVNLARAGVGNVGVMLSKNTNGGDPEVGWSMVGDPRLPRLLRKIMDKLPSAVKQDIPQQYRQFNMRQVRDKKIMNKQWEIVVSTLNSHGMEQRLPDCISIGVKKSGTNAVGFFITQHPQVSHSLGNEVHFFDKNYDKGLDYYKARMGFAKEGQLSFEKTPKYFVTEDAPEHILKDLSKDIKFIISVRNPVDRALSDFRHESELKLRRDQKARLKNINLSSRTAAGEGMKFEELALDKYGNVNASNVIIDTSNYAKHFKRWLKYFPRERFIIIDLETLEKGAFSKLKELEKFLGLSDYFKANMFYYDKSRHGTCMHGKLRPCPAKSTPGMLPKAKISDATMKKLQDFYRPSNKEFMQLTGQDFPWAHL